MDGMKYIQMHYQQQNIMDGILWKKLLKEE